jgi:hypothetical protein
VVEAAFGDHPVDVADKGALVAVGRVPQPPVQPDHPQRGGQPEDGQQRRGMGASRRGDRH